MKKRMSTARSTNQGISLGEAHLYVSKNQNTFYNSKRAFFGNEVNKNSKY